MRKLPICFGSSRQAAAWYPTLMSFEELCEKLKNPIRTPETTEQYHKMKKSERDQIKDKGGFLAGTLKGTKRKKADVISRSMITLDCDKANTDFFETFKSKYTAVVYTTHTHLPMKPRVRILIPLRRDVSAEEYNAIARYVAEDIGMEMIDPCSFEINQLMYWASCSSDGEYICRIYEGNWLDPNVFLSEHPDWRNCTELPTTPEEREVMSRHGAKQEDPLTKDGIVGACCRTYSIRDAVKTFLSDIYEETSDENRLKYIPSDSIPGVLIYDDKFAYSHHASDPAYGKELNAFDLVRVHKFDDDFKAMLEFASKDEKVQALALKERQERVAEDFEDENWKNKLTRKKNSTLVENSLHNIKLIMQNDPYLKNIVFNLFADGLEIKGEVPWQHPSKYWRDADDAQLICYVDDNYGTFSQRNYDIAITKTADDRSYHPVRDMFDALPKWDGIPRAETLLIDYLGAEDNEYVRAVTRKTLCAAYNRVYEPGVKFDTVLVLNGAQGIGKSTLINNLAMDWFSDSLTLSDMNDKTAAEKLQGYWIHEIGEMAGMKKIDIEKVKSFVSRRDDKYRASFGKRPTPHLRQCIFFGTTNSENGYLRDITGNRRFWCVRVSGKGKHKPWELNEEIVKQVWAETMIIAKSGETIYLSPELEKYAEREQRDAMEQDEREGLVIEYLDTLLPPNWDSMDIYSRREFLRDRSDPTRPEGTVRRETVSNMEIWCECFGRPKEDMKPADSYAIAALMVRVDGWKKSRERVVLPIYGRQRVYKRI